VILKDAARAGVGALLIRGASDESLICGVVAIEPTSIAGAISAGVSGGADTAGGIGFDTGIALPAGAAFPAGTAIHSPELEFVFGFVSAEGDAVAPGLVAAAGLGAARSCPGIDSSCSSARTIGRLSAIAAVAEIGSIDRNIAKANRLNRIVAA
jgi:hypothetical protein